MGSLHARHRGPRTVRDVGLLLIDDEADNASVNTVDPAERPGEFATSSPARSTARSESCSTSSRRGPTSGTRRRRSPTSTSNPTRTTTYGKDLFPSSFIEYLRPPVQLLWVRRDCSVRRDRPLPLNRCGTRSRHVDSRPPQGRPPGRTCPTACDRDSSLPTGERRPLGTRAARHAQLDADPRHPVHRGAAAGPRAGRPAS